MGYLKIIHYKRASQVFCERTEDCMEAGEEAASHLLHTVDKVLFNVEAMTERLRACRGPSSERVCLSTVGAHLQRATGLGYYLDLGF